MLDALQTQLGDVLVFRRWQTAAVPAGTDEAEAGASAQGVIPVLELAVRQAQAGVAGQELQQAEPLAREAEPKVTWQCPCHVRQQSSACMSRHL